MAMNLRSKNTKSSSGTSDVRGGESNVINVTPNPATVAADSPPQDNQDELTQNRLAQMAEVQEGWRKMVYAEFCMGARCWMGLFPGRLQKDRMVTKVPT